MRPSANIRASVSMLLAVLIAVTPVWAQAPTFLPPPTPQPDPVASASGPVAPMTLPDGSRLIPLPKISEAAVRELITDLVFHLEVTRNYHKAAPGVAELLKAPPARIVAVETVQRAEGGRNDILRFGYLLAPRRLPQLWVQGVSKVGGKDLPNADANADALDNMLQGIVAERSRLMSRIRLSDLESRIINLSYMDADGALFALRAMGYSAITNDDPLRRDDSYRGEDLALMTGLSGSDGTGAPGQSDPAAAAALGQPSGAPGDQRSGIRFPSIRNLPSSINNERLPLVVRMPSPDPRSTGLVGSSLGDTAQQQQAAQRDQLGLTVIPQAANPLADTVSAGTTQLLVLYHPNYPEQFFKLRRLIQDTIDRPARQVFVEGLVLEISNEGLRELGVKWDLKKGNQGFSLGAIGEVPAGGNALSLIRDTAVNISPTQIMARITALVEKNKAEILSRPSILTLDNRQATIRVGTDIPVATSKDAGSAGSGSTRVAFSFQYIPTGILLNVRPRISEDGQEISMVIDATVSATVPNADLKVLDPTTNIPLASAPTISTRRVQTYARIRDNQPLIIGGLVSRDQITGEDKVPYLGEVPYLGKLFGSESAQDRRREVIIVLTPSVVTENIRETKAQYPRDDDRFDLLGTSLFKEHYRIRAEDLIDSSYIRFNRRLLTYRNIVTQVTERNPVLAERAPFNQFTSGKVPGEFIFVSGMMHRMLDRMNADEPIKPENLLLFEVQGSSGEVRPIAITQLLARYGDGKDYKSFFDKNKGKALVMTFRLGRDSMQAGDLFSEPTPEIRIVDCPDRNVWRQLVWEYNQPLAGMQRYSMVINDASDLRRVQLAYATQNTILNNGGTAGMVFDRWLPGRMLHLQEVSPEWERILLAPIAQYFFIGEHYYMYFMRDHELAIDRLDKALRDPANAEAVAGIKLP